MYKNNWKSFKPGTSINPNYHFKFNSLNFNQKNTHNQNQYYNYPNNTMALNNMNRPNLNTKSLAYNNNLINNGNSNTTNIIDNSIKYMDFFLLDSYENIKNIKFIKDMSLNDTIFLNFDFNGQTKNNIYKINDLYSRYFFVKINNPEKQKSIGLLLPKNEINENIDIKRFVIYKINNSKLFKRDFENSLKMRFNGNYYFDLIENKNFTSNLFKYAFNILLNSNKDNNINQNYNSINNNNINSPNNFNNNINQSNTMPYNNISNDNYNNSMNNNNNFNNINNNYYQNNNNNKQNNNNNYQNNNNYYQSNNNYYQNNNNNQGINNSNNMGYYNNNQINNNLNNNNNNNIFNNYNNSGYQNNNLSNQNNTSINNNNNTQNNSVSNLNYYFPLKGLRNIGSTCYMNATLQCLIHSYELYAYFLNEYPNDSVNLEKKNKHVDSEGNLSRAFYNIIRELQRDNNNTSNSLNPSTNFCSHNSSYNYFNHNSTYNFFNNSKALSPGEFKTVLGTYNSQFRKFEANDSKDLILYLLQTMHEELNYFGENYSLPYKGTPNQFNEQNTFLYFMTSYNMRNFSIISSIFYGTYETITQCQKCKKNIYNFQKFEFISFGMFDYNRKVFNIYNGFEDNEKPQLLKGDNKFYCNHCKDLCEAILTCKIIQPPNKLLINIDYGKNKKFKPSKIEFDEEIDITKYINFNFNTKIRYRIICVCTHLGQSGSCGHYVAYCRHRLTGKWYEFNDSSCNECNAKEIYTGSPYLLLYERI